MKELLYKQIHYVITAITLIICGVFLINNREQLALLNNVALGDFILLFIVLFLFFIATGYTFKLVVNLLGVKLDIWEVIGLSIITSFGNYFGPTSPGSVIKAVYLKSSKGLEYARFTSVFTVNNFVGLFMTGIVGCMLYALLVEQMLDPPIILLAVSVILILGSVLPFVLKIPKFRVKGSVTEILSRALEGFETMRTQKSKLFLICASYLLQFFICGWLYAYSFQAIGIDISFLLGLVIAIFTTMANFVTITPNNIGIQEAISAYIFAISGYDFTTGVIGAGLIRVVHLIITFSMAPVFMHYLFKSEDLKKAKFW